LPATAEGASFEVRSLQLARAFLLAALVSTDANAKSEARALAHEVEHDPNDIAASLRSEIAKLRARLG
jgi:hypothetical protein